MRKIYHAIIAMMVFLHGCSNYNVYERGYEAGKSEIQTMEAKNGISGEATQISVSPEISKIVQLDDGFKLSIPKGAIFSSDELKVESSTSITDTGSKNDLVLVGPKYEIDLQNSDFFHGTVELTLPYDPSQIPIGHSEEDVYVAYYYEGEWISTYGEVDTQNHTITVQTVHNGLWAVVISLVENVGDQVNFWFSNASQKPQNIEEARQLVRDREIDAEQILQDLDFQVEYVDEFQQEKLIPYAAPALMKKVDKQMLEWFLQYGVENSGGALFVLKWAGKPFLLINAIRESYLLYELSEGWGELLAYRAKWERANARLIEARCILYGMEHPLSRTFPPECSYLFSTYANAYEQILTEENIDFEQSAIPSLDELTLIVTTSPEATSTLPAPPTTTPQPTYPTLYADKNYQCREGPTRAYGHVADIYSGTSYRIIGRASNGWYAIAIDDSSTSQKSCWIGGGNVSGDVSSVTYYEVQTPTSEPGGSGLVTVVDGEPRWNDDWCYNNNDPNYCYAVYSLTPLGTITCEELKAYGWSNPFTVNGNKLWLIDELLFGSPEAAFYDYEARNACTGIFP